MAIAAALLFSLPTMAQESVSISSTQWKVTHETPPTTHELIVAYAVRYEVSITQMTGTIDCESQFYSKAYNPHDGHGGAKGIGQFLQGTFDHYAPLAGVKKGDVWNAEDSIHVMAYMFSIGEAKQWTCWRNKYGDK